MKKVLVLTILCLPMALWLVLTIVNIIIESMCDSIVLLFDKIEI